jgi:[acyl-carrier-protein] S-malonyltransferase
MGKALADNFPAAKAVFDEVDAALNESLTQVMWDGPIDALTLTANAQPALMAVSLAALRVLETEAGLDLAREAAFVAGHSLGEYSALAAAGALTITEAARLLRIRGRAMQEAVPVGEGAMAALLGLDYDQAVAVAAEAAGDDVCEAANDNAPGQVVVSGTKAAVERAIVIAKEKGAMKALLLPVSAPFHCRLMGPAAEAMEVALSGSTVMTPRVPLVANVRASPVTDPAEIVRLLVEQVTGTVRWRESVIYMAGAGVTRMVEIGAGKVLCGLVKRIDKSVSTSAVGTAEDVAAFIAARNAAASAA